MSGPLYLVDAFGTEPALGSAGVGILFGFVLERAVLVMPAI